MKCLVCGYLGGGFKPDGVTQYLKGVFAGPPSGVEYVISEQQAIRLRDAPEYSFLQGVETIPLRENHLEFKLGGSLEPLGFHVKNILSLGGSEALAGVDLVFTSQGLVYTDIPQVASLDESLIRPQYLTRGRPTDFEDSRALVDGMQKKILWDVVSRGSFKRILAWSERAREDLISVCPGAEEKSSVLRPPVDLPDINSRTGGRDTVR
ncbi:MAG: hypothetical protein ABH834_01295, partial [Candidatus Altiarchaeota archaeon]